MRKFNCLLITLLWIELTANAQDSLITNIPSRKAMSLPDKCRTTNWATSYDKPLFISETGAGAKGGFYADSLTRFSEEYQEWYYKEQVAMFKRMPDNFVGLSPWVLTDFRSPKRNNPVYQ